jgi:hypothetical protein
MGQPQPGDALLKWAALAVPGIAAGLGWAATEGLPAISRVVSGIAIGLVIYAVVHVAINGFRGRGGC